MNVSENNRKKDHVQLFGIIPLGELIAAAKL